MEGRQVPDPGAGQRAEQALQLISVKDCPAQPGDFPQQRGDVRLAGAALLNSVKVCFGQGRLKSHGKYTVFLYSIATP